MQKDLLNTVNMLLFVNREPSDITRTYTEKDVEGKPVREVKFNEQTLRGILLTNAYGTNILDMEIQIRPEQLNSAFPSAPKFSEVLKAFVRKEEEFLTGSKLILAKVSNQPRTHKMGEKAGVTTGFVPVLVGYEIVDAKPEDVKFIEGVLASQNKLTDSDADATTTSVA